MNFEELIQKELKNFFSKFYVIDVLSDKVYSLNNISGITLEKTKSFFDFMQEVTPLLHEDDIKKYFDNLTISTIEANNGSIIYECRIKEDGKFVKKLIFSSILNDSSGKKVLVSYFNSNLSDKSEKELKEVTDRLKTISSNVSDAMLKIYNALDSSNDNSGTKGYITTLLDNLINDFPEFKNEFEKDIISQVNKVKNTLLVADDDLITRNLIKKTFSDEFDIVYATNGQEAINILEKVGIDNIVGMFLDLLMPVMDGFEVLDYLRSKNILYKVPIIIISGAEDRETRQRVYQYNIADLLEKPFNLEVIKYRTKNLIKLYRTSNSLNNMVISQYNDLTNIVDELVKSYKYDNTDRINRIKSFSKIIISELKNNFPEYKITDYIESKIIDSIDLFDIGYYAIPRTIGIKGTISKEENEMIKNYPRISSVIAQRYQAKFNDDDLNKYSKEICLYCHEKYDGSGFPSGISKDDIPISAQIVSLAIYIENVFIKTKDILMVNKYIKKNEFNPKLISVLPNILDKIKK